MNSESKPRSKALTIVAWILIIYFGFQVVTSLGQATLLLTVSKSFTDSFMGFSNEYVSMFDNSAGFNFSKIFKLMMKFQYVLIPLSLLLEIGILLAAIGLLNRKNLGRIGLITLFSIKIATIVAARIFQVFILDMARFPGMDGPDNLINIFSSFSVILTLASGMFPIGILIGFIFYLCTKGVKGECRPGEPLFEQPVMQQN